MHTTNLIEVAISCLNDDIFKALSNVKKYTPAESVTIHIIHQVTNEVDYKNVISEITREHNFKYSKLDKIGLPLSRNYALNNTTAQYLIPTDADVVLISNFNHIINNAFEKHTDAGLISFKSFYDHELTSPRKRFKLDDFKHSARTLLSVSSIEIVLKVDVFKAKKVLWDIDFGLGAFFPGGLETVMLNDAYNAGISCWYVSKPISIHPEISSGSHVSEKKVYIRSAVFCRLYGQLIGVLFSFIFYIKNPVYLKKLGFFTILKNILKGRKNFLLRKK